ncbi:hypothetical protein BDZ91DRAFT_763601 [Kalaharituber pfeilii]|nr:hypothetical protein BDZ91DRAFT_763601 [Kalaharituber pfeilii]
MDSRGEVNSVGPQFTPINLPLRGGDTSNAETGVKRKLTLQDAFNLTQHVYKVNMPRMVPKSLEQILRDASVVSKLEQAGPAQYHIAEITEWWGQLILGLINEAIERGNGTPM